MYAVDRDITQAGFRPANLHVFAFAFVALQGDARQAADGVRDICVWQTGDHFRRKDLDDVLSGALNVDGLGFALHPLSGNQNLVGLGCDLQDGVDGSRIAHAYFDVALERGKADIGDGELVIAGRDLADAEESQVIGDGLSAAWLKPNARALQSSAPHVFRCSNHGAAIGLGVHCGGRE